MVILALRLRPLTQEGYGGGDAPSSTKVDATGWLEAKPLMRELNMATGISDRLLGRDTWQYSKAHA